MQRRELEERRRQEAEEEEEQRRTEAKYEEEEEIQRRRARQTMDDEKLARQLERDEELVSPQDVTMEPASGRKQKKATPELFTAKQYAEIRRQVEMQTAAKEAEFKRQREEDKRRLDAAAERAIAAERRLQDHQYRAYQRRAAEEAQARSTANVEERTRHEPRQLFPQLPGSGGHPFGMSSEPPPSGAGERERRSAQRDDDEEYFNSPPPVTAPAPFRGQEDTATVGDWLRRLMVVVDFHTTTRRFRTEGQRVAYAATLLEGAAQDWWQQVGRTTVQTFNEFVEAVQRRFTNYADAQLAAQQLGALVQGRDTVSQYAAKVTKLLGRMPITTDAATRVRYFVDGLDKAIAEKVRYENPATVDQAIVLAQRTEAARGLMQREWAGPQRQPQPTRQQHVNSIGMNETTNPAEQTQGQTPQIEGLAATGIQGRGNGTGRRLTNEEWLARQSCNYCRELGHLKTRCPYGGPVCFKCKTRDHLWPQCPNRSMPRQPTATPAATTQPPVAGTKG